MLEDYTITLLAHLKERGMKKVYIYHDMLAEHELLNSDFADRLKKEGVYDVAAIDR